MSRRITSGALLALCLGTAAAALGTTAAPVGAVIKVANAETAAGAAFDTGWGVTPQGNDDTGWGGNKP